MTRDLRKRPEGVTREQWAAHKKKVAAERARAKDPAAVALGKKRMANVPGHKRTALAKNAARRRWDKEKKRERERRYA